MYVDATYARWAAAIALYTIALSALYAQFRNDYGGLPYVLVAWAAWVDPAMCGLELMEAVRYLIVVTIGGLFIAVSWYTPVLTEFLLLAGMLARGYPISRPADGRLSPEEDMRRWSIYFRLAVRNVALAASLGCYATGLMTYAQRWHDDDIHLTYLLMLGVAWMDAYVVRPFVRERLPNPKRCFAVYLHVWFALPWYTVLYSLPDLKAVVVLHALAPDTWSAGPDGRMDAALWIQTFALTGGVACGHLIWVHHLIPGRFEYYGGEELASRTLVSALFSIRFVTKWPSLEGYEPLRVHQARQLIPSLLTLTAHAVALGVMSFAALM